MLEDVKKRIDLLSNPVWTYKEIMQFDTSIKSKNTAIKIKDRVKNIYGSVLRGPQYCKSEDVLKLYGTTREDEMKRLGAILNEEKLH